MMVGCMQIWFFSLSISLSLSLLSLSLSPRTTLSSHLRVLQSVIPLSLHNHFFPRTQTYYPLLPPLGILPTHGQFLYNSESHQMAVNMALLEVPLWPPESLATDLLLFFADHADVQM